MEIIPFSGWERNARLVCNNTEMLVTLDIGPRIISYGPVGGPNLFLVDPTTAGMTGGEEMQTYGGHRLWIAPEHPARTFQPDNVPVEMTEEDGWFVFTAPKDINNTQKEMRIKPEPELDRFIVEHRIYNHSPYHLDMAAWAPTQCSGGEIVWPQAEYVPHSERVLPARPITLWNYTKMGDPRWSWGERVVRLKHDANMGPQKAGALIQQGYAVCVNEGYAFLKRFDFDEYADYPDYGVNFEAFTREDMLEIETLGGMEIVPPGDFTEHREVWYLVPNQVVPADEDACADWLADLALVGPFE